MVRGGQTERERDREEERQRQRQRQTDRQNLRRWWRQKKTHIVCSIDAGV